MDNYGKGYCRLLAHMFALDVDKVDQLLHELYDYIELHGTRDSSGAQNGTESTWYIYTQ